MVSRHVIPEIKVCEGVGLAEPRQLQVRSKTPRSEECLGVVFGLGSGSCPFCHNTKFIETFKQRKLLNFGRRL